MGAESQHPGRGRWAAPEALALVVLTLVAFAVRLPAVDESLTLDEPHTWVMAQLGLGDLLGELRAGYEIHPPLYFVLAWAAAKVADPTVWVRVPSLVLGTAAVPLTYVLGRRTVGRAAAGIGALLLALSPFAVRVSTEARPYATLIFFVVVSTLALLLAAQSNRLLAWALYVLSACGLLYTHYFGALVVLAQLGWALWACRTRLRTVAAVYGVVVLGFLPWVPSFLAQPHSSSDYAASVPLGASWLAEQSVGLFPGTGYFSWREIPGRPAVIAVVLTLGVLLAAATATVWGPQRRWRHLLEAWGALVVLALVVPIGLLLFSIGGDNVWVSRYLALALPAIVLLLGGLISLAPRPVAWGAAAALIGVLAVGTAKSFDEPYRRAGYKEAARFIESKATPRDVVLEFFLSSNASRRGPRYVSPIDLNFAERRRTIVGSLRSARRVFNDPPPEGRVFVAGIEGGFLRLPRPGRDDGLCLVRRRVFPGGDAPVTVYVYGEAGKARPCPEA